MLAVWLFCRSVFCCGRRKYIVGTSQLAKNISMLKLRGNNTAEMNITNAYI